MNAIIVTRHIDSAHLELPELLAFVGKEVEIRIVEKTPPVNEVPDRWKPLMDAAALNVIDDEAIREFRAIDMADSEREAQMWAEIYAERDANATR